MNRTHLVIALCSVVALAAGIVLVASQNAGVVAAQGPDLAGVSVTAATVSSRINYQGVLKEGGSPVTGNRNFTFRFYTDAGCAAQVGSPNVLNDVAINNGLFSVKLDVDQTLFDGQGLWLGVDVGSTGSNTACEEITPAPYALSLRPGAVIVGNLSASPILSVTNTYSPTVGMASDGENDSSALQGFSTRGSGVCGDSASGAGVDGLSIIDIGGSGVYGISTSGAGVGGFSMSDNGGVFATGSGDALGLLVENKGGGKAARFVGGVEINGDVNVAGEVYAQSLHTKSGGITTAGITTDGKATFPQVTVPQTGGGKIETTPDGLNVKDNGGNNKARLTSLGDLMVQNFSAAGQKLAVVSTATYGQRGLYTDESAELYFFDRGGGQLVNGVAVITLDPIWLETVTIDADHPMRVQVTLTGDCNGVYVSEKTATGFTVRELRGGASNATFDWEVAAKRKGYEDVRLAPVEPGQP